MPLVQTLSHLIFFLIIFLFFGKNLEILNYYYYLKKNIYIYIYIHEQSTSNATWIFRIQRNIETRNKQTNFKINQDVATKCGVRQSWATCFFLVHLGCLRLGMLEPWLWWNGLGLHLEGMHLVSFWPLMLIMHIHFWWAQALGLDSFKKQIGLPFLVEFNLRLLGLS